MTTSDVSQILAAISSLTDRFNDAMVKLAHIEERTGVLKDHELRLRAAEESARVAGETAVNAAGIATAQSRRISALEEHRLENGRFTPVMLLKFVATAAVSSGAIFTIALVIHNW